MNEFATSRNSSEFIRHVNQGIAPDVSAAFPTAGSGISSSFRQGWELESSAKSSYFTSQHKNSELIR